MNDNDAQIDQAVSILRAGGLVAFPTETVYGLGADASNADAVARVFAAKGRPPGNPLIVHVAGIDAARRYSRTWPDAADQLARAFWPGPLTLVLPKSPAIVLAVTAGRESVGLRSPDHPLALRLLSAADLPPIPAVMPCHTVLVAPEPGEVHILGAAMDSEVLWHAG